MFFCKGKLKAALILVLLKYILLGSILVTLSPLKENFGPLESSVVVNVCKKKKIGVEYT